jgi:DNA-binding NarL/FixJ family response regulator
MATPGIRNRPEPSRLPFVVIRTLLVDDVVDVRRLVRTALRVRGGFEVVGEASDGAEAVALAGDTRPDVVVLDLGLPDIAGQEVLSRIREAAPRTKVVIFSGSDTERAALDSHVDGFLLKDTKVEYLVDLLEAVGEPRGLETEIDLPQALTSAAEARRFVSATVTEWELAELLDDAILVASELATNAVTHADSRCRIRLSLNPTSLRIDVIDSGTGTPEPQPESSTEEHGRGLHLIDALADAWGLEQLPGDGKVVWAELARPR